MKLKKGSKKAKAWGRKMKRLRAGALTPKRKTRKRSSTMVKRKRVARRRSSSLLSGGKLMNGVFPAKGIISKMLAGLALSEISEQVAPKIVPYQNLIVAGAVGGLPGVAAAFGFNMLQGKGVTNTSGTGITFY